MTKSLRLGLAIALVTLAVGNVFAADKTPVKVSLFPKLAYPLAQTVHGLDLGLIATQTKEVQGVQLAWIYGSTTKKMVGLQTGFITTNQGEVTGAELSFVALNDGKVTGLQYGFYNGAKNMTGLQLGFINVAETMKGVQVGLVNVIKTGIVPAMVFVNANF
jgi:hypothetical protein